jgi:MarR family transcriptional regulator, transcriptional regulator for hemolysin
MAYRIYRCARLLRSHFQALAASNGIELSQEQWFILNRLAQHGSLSQVDLGDHFLDDRPNIARLVATLESKGMVQRGADANDRRKYSVTLTAEGRRLHDSFAALVPTARTQSVAGIAKSDLAIAMRVLSTIEENIE